MMSTVRRIGFALAVWLAVLDLGDPGRAGSPAILQPRALAAQPAPGARTATRGDEVIAWNALTLDAVRAGQTPPPVAARNLTMVHAAIYDAVNAIAPTYRTYHVPAVASRAASPEAAAAAAAHRVLVSLYPARTGTFNAALASSLGEVPDGPSKTEGIALGRSVAEQVLAWRRTDGWDRVVIDTPGTRPGDWRPTPPDFARALLPQWAQLTPFAMTSGAQFRPAGPPALSSPEYAAAVQEVQTIGGIDSRSRTMDQTTIAYFWADGAGTVTPPGHCNQVAVQVALRRHTTLAENARLFALLNIALADAAIVAWDAKFAFNFWRPITAIRQAGGSAKPRIARDPNWTPLLVTPPFPSYVSRHSTFTGAADAILTSFFGPDVRFLVSSDALPGLVRSYGSFSAAADEAGMSRVYGGIHYSFDNRDGLAAGRALGRYVFQNFLVPVERRAARSSPVLDHDPVIQVRADWTPVTARRPH